MKVKAQTPRAYLEDRPRKGFTVPSKYAKERLIQWTPETAAQVARALSRQAVQAKELETLRKLVCELQARLETLTAAVERPHQPALSRPPTPEHAADRQWAALLRQGEAVRAGWVADGQLVSSTRLASAWGRTRQALDHAVKRGELFSLKIGKNLYYPAAFLTLEADAVKTVCLALRGDDASGKFVFWTQEHGGLDGRTVAQAIAAGELAAVVRLAVAWSAERGFPA